MIKIIVTLGVYALFVFPNVTATECEKFHGIASWTQEFVDSICSEAGLTNKGSTAVLCSPDAGNVEYESSLKLAILNSMYGKSASAQCREWCMYDPLHLDGNDAVGFKWSGSGGCWRVIRGKTNNLCYKRAYAEYEWALAKAENMCEDSPDCHVFQGIASWTTEYLESICDDTGKTDKSTTAVLCSPHAGNMDYETSLKLAILNQMYGTETTTSGNCQWWCMYDPLHVAGSDAVAFRWSNNQQCWKVLVGSTDFFCNDNGLSEWSWAIAKTENWCLASGTGV